MASSTHPTESRPEAEGTLVCEVCLREIPRSVAKSAEGPDYVFHFCGTECYSKWETAAAEDRSGTGATASKA